MTWIDITSVALFVVVGIVEAKRGAVPAMIDLALVLFGLRLAKSFTMTVAASLGSEVLAFSLLFFGCVVFVGMASTLFDSYTKWDIGTFDPAVAGILGAVSGLVVAHAVFHAAILNGGSGLAVANASVLLPEVYELRTIHALGDILHNLGGGPRIVDQVKEQQQ